MPDSVCRNCRRAGEKLFLKGEKCFTPKCIFEKRPIAPGKASATQKRRPNLSEYGRQLREKQKVKHSYGVDERQFANYVSKATLSGGSTANDLFKMLESRLDRVVFRAGLAPSQRAARLLVSHGHIMVNGKRVTVPSYQVDASDIISVRAGSASSALFANLEERLKNHAAPAWISFDAKKKEGRLTGAPRLDATVMPFDLSSIIEFYSR
ncbi:MAG: 30S ribosomal protein S4 [Candidatus Lloydbacteria bacterium CG22_combo_CG10-13_8_21_14_all_47_15]|uniref:Small ribosomal subunit protein uS4 n=1 Tax=Candidatus Lloydbacteria bacterium CG22_combo_CG10-13_8_21_14_all_47_15 TaxID=1974635 RepID=A0A2H0CTP6_9BACT|nr:MAG: 30S ribosomal protein S4 [Candidatus Lloydbacteria bacterium CG22_combo_CG10-13_8_21_14_all_47_15]